MTVQQVFHPSVVTEVIHYDGDDVRLGLAQHQLGPGEEEQQLPNHVGRDCDLVSCCHYLPPGDSQGSRVSLVSGDVITCEGFMYMTGSHLYYT